MGRWVRDWSLLSLMCGSLGCALCASPFDYDYVTYGSRTPRQDMRHGRVGSPLSDPALNGGGTIESIEAIDSEYGEILEGADDGPIFMDEASIEPSLIDDSF